MDEKKMDEYVCEDCNKKKLPLGQSMYDNKWRCLKCNSIFIKKWDKENVCQYSSSRITSI